MKQHAVRVKNAVTNSMYIIIYSLSFGATLVFRWSLTQDDRLLLLMCLLLAPPAAGRPVCYTVFTSCFLITQMYKLGIATVCYNDFIFLFHCLYHVYHHYESSKHHQAMPITA